MTASFVHFEIPAENVERASTFYRKTFGWAVDKMPEMEYSVVRTDSETGGMAPDEIPPDGGIGPKQGPNKVPHLTIIIDDLDAVAAQIEKNGGKILRKKHAMGDSGFSATFSDPEGNTVGLFQPSSG
jgi:predicted enzyme related to lactoylglutathione lyase